VELVGADVIQRGKSSAEDMIAAPESAGSFDGKDVGSLFDDANLPANAALVLADFAMFLSCKEAADGARAKVFGGFVERSCEVQRSGVLR
jgi:hypothetical protein